MKVSDFHPESWFFARLRASTELQQVITHVEDEFVSNSVLIDFDVETHEDKWEIILKRYKDEETTYMAYGLLNNSTLKFETVYIEKMVSVGPVAGEVIRWEYDEGDVSRTEFEY